MYSIVCNCDPGRGDQPWKWAKEYANSWRTNIDAQIGWQAVPYLVDCQRRMAGNGSWCLANGSSWVNGQQVQSTPGDGGVPCKCSAGHLGGACLEPAAEPQGGPQQFSGNDGGKGGHWNDMDMCARCCRLSPLLPLLLRQEACNVQRATRLVGQVLVARGADRHLNGVCAG